MCRDLMPRLADCFRPTHKLKSKLVFVTDTMIGSNRSPKHRRLSLCLGSCFNDQSFTRCWCQCSNLQGVSVRANSPYQETSGKPLGFRSLLKSYKHTLFTVSILRRDLIPPTANRQPTTEMSNSLSRLVFTTPTNQAA